jgi:hypothetical protein
LITDEDALRYIDIFISDCHEHATSQDEYDIPDCAGSLCRIDIEKFGYDEWKTWTPEDIVNIFVEVTDATMSDLLDELASSYAGEELIEELLGSEQTFKVDYERAAHGVRVGAVKMMKSLGMYLKIKREISCLENF